MDFFDVQERNEVFEAMAAYQTPSFALTDDDNEATRVRGTRASRDFFALLGVAPLLGRSFESDEDQPGGRRVAILSHRLWTTRFAEDQDVLGRLITLDGDPYEVIGVMPPEFQFPMPVTDFWTPLQINATSTPRGNHGFLVVARLAPEADLEAATANLDTIAGALEAEFTDDNQGCGMWAEPFYDSLVGEVRALLLVLLGAVGFVLLTACVNVANLLFARSMAREQEVAVRTAMGATRGVLFRQYLMESLILSVIGCGLGLWLAHFGLKALLELLPSGLPRLENVGLNATVLAFTIGLSLATALVFGLLPAIHAGRRDLIAPLKEGARSGTGTRRNRLRQALVVAEIGLAVVLVTGAGLLIHSFWNLTRVDPGFSATNVVSAAPASRYPQIMGQFPEWTEVRTFQNELLSGLETMPGVRSAAFAINTPLDAGWTTRFTIDGRVAAAPGEQDEVRIRVVTPSYFETVGLPVVKGRSLDPRDNLPNAPPVVLVNEAFVDRYFPEEEPLARRVSNWGVSREIVGVVKDVRFRGLQREAQPALYPTFSQMPFAGFTMLVRTAEEPESLYARIRERVWSLDRDLALSNFTTLERRLSRSVAQPRFTTLLVTLFATVALLLAAVGIYGVMSSSVSQRAREIGVRISFGASTRDILGLVLGEGFRLALIGLAAGIATALAVTRTMEALLFGVGRFDLSTYGVVAAVAVLVALAASYVPAIRATRVDPIITLRHD